MGGGNCEKRKMKKRTVQYWFGLTIGFGLGVLAAALLLEEKVVAGASGVSLLKVIGILVAFVAGVTFGVWRRDLPKSNGTTQPDAVDRQSN
jgi:hypothetical protein